MHLSETVTNQIQHLFPKSADLVASDIQLVSTDWRASIMIFGEGGEGKTTLVNHLTREFGIVRLEDTLFNGNAFDKYAFPSGGFLFVGNVNGGNPLELVESSGEINVDHCPSRTWLCERSMNDTFANYLVTSSRA